MDIFHPVEISFKAPKFGYESIVIESCRENGETIENAQTIAAYQSRRTTKFYDRTRDEITLDEVERILI